MYVGYIPPNADDNVYHDHIESIKSIELTNNDKMMIAGDFNLPGINWLWDDEFNSYFPTNVNYEPANYFLSEIAHIGVFQMSNISNRYGNVLDLVFTSQPDSFVIQYAPKSITAAAEKSTLNERIHYPYEWEIEIEQQNSNVKSKTEKIHCFKKANFDEINKLWNAFDLNQITTATTIEEIERIFYDKMNECIQLHVPSITPKNFSNKHPPWFDRQLINLKNKLDKARKRIKLTGSSIEFDDMNSRFITYFNTRIVEYQAEQNLLCKQKPKKFWEHINTQRKSKGYPQHMEFDGITLDNETDIAQTFNDHFASVFTPDATVFSINDFLNQPNLCNEQIDPIDTDEVYRELSTLDISKGVGLDGIHPILLKTCAESLTKVICAIFNKSIELGEVPKAWKVMKIIPIFKNGKRSSIKQYRPIAIPPCLAKIQDKIMTTRLNAMIGDKITIHQHGFVKKRNTATNILELTQEGFNSFAENAQVDVFFADLSKAFDKVKHSRLLEKLANLGVSKHMLKWQWSFLKDRTQITKVGNSLSTEAKVTSGIIQGGHQSPICFDAYINDLPSVIPDATVECFADDTKVYRKVVDISDVHILQTSIDMFHIWCDENFLDVNKDKCHIMTMAWKRNPIEAKYMLDGQEIHRVSQHKDLGVLLDTKLTMIPHIDQQINKAKSMLALIKRFGSGLLNQSTMRTLYMCLVRSHLDYASIVYNPNCDIHINKLESVQRQYALYAFRHERNPETFHMRPYIDRCTDLRINTLSRRRTNTGILFIYDLIENNIIAPTLNNLITRRTSTYALRRNEYINMPLVTRGYLFNNPFLTMCRNFNKISNIYLDSSSRNEFKSVIESLPDSFFQ